MFSSASFFFFLFPSFQVCREFQRGTCTRQPNECRFAHPPENVTVESTDNHVTVCMDFVKGKCARDSCRYFHPPSHLQAQIKAAQQRVASASVATASSALVRSLHLLFVFFSFHHYFTLLVYIFVFFNYF